MSGHYKIRIEARFESAHFLRSYRGEPEPLHGHSYKVEAELMQSSAAVDHESIAVDFVSSEQELRALARRLDYKCINDVAPFDQRNPTAENIAQWFHQELSAALGAAVHVATITVWEGPFHSATFTAER